MWWWRSRGTARSCGGGVAEGIDDAGTVGVEFAAREALAVRLTVLATQDGKEAVIDEVQVR